VVKIGWIMSEWVVLLLGKEDSAEIADPFLRF
jgi:hypothetical protein